jgi:hypothetical protein
MTTASKVNARIMIGKPHFCHYATDIARCISNKEVLVASVFLYARVRVESCKITLG